MGNILTMPISFAIKDTIKRFENATGDNEKFILESLKRSDIVWDNITYHGIEDYGITYDQFCYQFKEKNNVVFLSDEEFKTYVCVIKNIDKYSALIKLIDELK